MFVQYCLPRTPKKELITNPFISGWTEHVCIFCTSVSLRYPPTLTQTKIIYIYMRLAYNTIVYNRHISTRVQLIHKR